MAMKELIEVSLKYGQDQDYVLAGGGNTSLKEDGVMYVKASGTSLSTIKESDFVKMSMDGLASIWTKDYSEDTDLREEEALADLMSMRLEGESKRPSVETLLHSFIPFRYVVHTHPAMVNGLSCSQKGEEIAADLFGDEMLWIPVVNPGYILAKYVKDRVDECLAKGMKFPRYILLQNHGVFVAGDSIDTIDKDYAHLMGVLEEQVLSFPNMTESQGDIKPFLPALKESYCEDVAASFYQVKACDDYLVSKEAVAPLMSSLTPDHIVYMGHMPLWIDASSPSAIAHEIVVGVSAYEKEFGKKPKTILLKGQGIISCGTNAKEAELSRLLFLDALKVSFYSQFFGGIQHMPQDKIDFINNWEVEKYRAKASTS